MFPNRGEAERKTDSGKKEGRRVSKTKQSFFKCEEQSVSVQDKTKIDKIWHQVTRRTAT